MSPPGIRASSNRPQAMSFETYQADPSNQRQPRITGGGIAAVSATQISRLCRQGLAFCGLASNTQGVEVRPATDIENPLPLAEAGHRTEIDQALHQLSTDFIKEEQRAIDPALRDAFSALQKTMNDTQDYSNMPQARALLLQMHGMEPDKVERGFERGGAVYSYRSIVGSTMAFLPLILTGIKTQQEYAKNLTFQLGMSAGYFGSVILASCAGVAVNARTLLHCTPIQDAEFDGSPYVSKELMSVNTPSYPKIQEELEASLKKATQLSTLLATTLADSNGLSEEDKKNTCMRLINEADISDKNDPGVKHYVARAQLHRAYIEGIQLQAGFQTMKVFGNLAAGWVSFLKNNPRLGIYVQLGVGLGQIVMQRVVAPADQKKLQYALLELEIMSRPLAGKNTQADDQEIRKMLRTPREVRVFNLESLTTAYITVLAQQIGDLLGMSAAEFEEYRRLLARKKNSEELTTAKTKVDEAYADIPAEVRFGIFPRLNVESPQSSEPRLFEALVADICEITASSRNDIVRLVELSRRDSDGKIAEGDGHHLDNLHTALGEKIADLSSFGQSALSGNVKLNRATERAVRRRSAQNAGFNSELAAAAFGTLSSRFSDEEILANIIDEISQQKQLPWLQMRPANQEGTNAPQSQHGHFDAGSSSYKLNERQLEKIRAVLSSRHNFSVDQFNELIDLTDPAKRLTLSGDQKTQLLDLKSQFENALKNLDSENIFTIWGVEGLDAALISATRTKDYVQEDLLCDKIAQKLGSQPNAYKVFHELRMLCSDQHMSALTEKEILKLHQFETARQAGLTALGDASSKVDSLENEYALIENDPHHIIQRRFDKVSDQHKQLVLDGMHVTRDEGLFTLKRETGMLLKEGNRRAGNAPEYMAAYAAGMWRAFQLGVTGVNGPLIMTAAVSLIEQIYKTTLDDPQSFKPQPWPKIITTGISMAALTANILAAHRIAEAKAAPLPWNLQLQKAFGGTGSIAETKFQVAKLDFRTKCKEETTSDGAKKYVEIGAARIASKYFWNTLQAGAEIKNGLAVLICGGREALATRKAYDKRKEKIRIDTEERQALKAQLQARPS